MEAQAELEWSKKPSTIELKRQLQNFLDSNPLTKEEPKKLGFWGYVVAFYGVMFLWSMSHILTYPQISGGMRIYLLVVGLGLVYGCVFIIRKIWSSSGEQVPDEDAISRKQSLENEIAKSKKTYVRQKLL